MFLFWCDFKLFMRNKGCTSLPAAFAFLKALSGPLPPQNKILQYLLIGI